MTRTNSMRDERERVAAEYRRRDADPQVRARYDQDRPAVRRARARRRADVRRALEEEGIRSLADLSILEVGCGSGGVLEDLVALGATPVRVRGIDLSAERLAHAAPELRPRLLQADAADLPFADGAFDLVAQFTLLSSVLDPSLRRAIATEMTRVLRPSGTILWYDMRRTARRARTVALDAADIAALFPGFAVRARTVTLAPPIDRALPERLAPLARALTAVPVLRTHIVATLRRA